MSAPFAGQVAIVTGGAGGIGLATAQQLAKDGVNVALVDMQQSALDKAQSTLCAAVPGASCMTIAGDVADTAEADSAVHRVLSRWGRLDILVQAAGITGKTNLKTADVDPANFDQVLRVNLRGIFAFCRAALRVMSKAGYGRIVNIASIAGKEGNAGMLALFRVESRRDWPHQDHREGVRRDRRHHVQRRRTSRRAHGDGRGDAGSASQVHDR